MSPTPPIGHDCAQQWERVFGLVNRHELGLIDGMKQDHVTIEAGVDIVSEGARGRSLYCVCNGWAARYHRLRDGSRQILDVLLPGDTIALAAVLLGSSTYSVQSLTPASFCALDGGKIVALFKSSPSFAFGMLRGRVEDEHRTDTRLTLLGRMGAERRVGYFLVETYDRLRQRGMTDGPKCLFPMRRSDLADAVGLSRVHIMRSLRTLRSQALIDLRGRDLIVPDFARLAAHTGYISVLSSSPLTEAM